MTIIDQVSQLEGVQVHKTKTGYRILVPYIPIESDHDIGDKVRCMISNAAQKNVFSHSEHLEGGFQVFDIEADKANRTAVYWHEGSAKVHIGGNDGFSVRNTDRSGVIILTTGHHEFEIDNNPDADIGYLTITILNNGDHKTMGVKAVGNKVHLTDHRHSYVLKNLR